jgi:RNA polymerase sigma-54 factor
MLKQRLQQKLQQKLSPQQIQLMKLLQVPTIALEQRVKQELEENPALEDSKEEEPDDIYGEEDYGDDDNSNQDEFDLSDYMDEDDLPSYRYKANNHSADDEDKEVPFAAGATFHDLLRNQLQMRDLDERQMNIASFLIGNFDDSGYLHRDLTSLVDDFAFTQNIMTDEKEIESVLKVIQSFDPPGVGARDLQECLLIQLDKKDTKEPVIKLARLIINRFFIEFTKKHYNKIIKRANTDEEQLKLAMDEILKLNPKPGNSLSESIRVNYAIIPDFTITIESGEPQLSLNSRNAPELQVSPQYREMMEAYTANKKRTSKDKEAILFIKQKLDSAKWFIDAIKQRQQTLYLTMRAIMDYQKAYFVEGDETLLKPMILKDIAEIVNMDISTISRVVNSKYVQTPFGTFLLKSFFSESITTDSGEEVSTREVKKILLDCIEDENKKKPLTDERLSQILREKGYNIARRTVAKYREQLNIPVARLRKEL